MLPAPLLLHPSSFCPAAAPQAQAQAQAQAQLGSPSRSLTIIAAVPLTLLSLPPLSVYLPAAGMV
jgi:hypothetical protein